ncbi:MAG: GNAT family N-acetyltransferase [Byssovorax sp.]
MIDPDLSPTIAVESIASPDARALIALLDADISERYPNPDDNFFELSPEEVAPENGAFVIARANGRAIGCGAVRRIDATTAEIKRMYVAREARGRGVSRRILAALEDEARRIGVTRLVLETGDRQVEAVALYLRAGFERIPRFGEYVTAPLSACFGKDLEPRSISAG